MEDSPPSELPPELFVDPVAGSDESRDYSLTAGEMGKLQPFKTLSHALRQAAPGTIIYLQPGCYDTAQGETFPLHIPPGVRVVGDVPTRGGKTAIVGGGDWESPIFGRQNAALVVAEQAQVQGITVTNPHPKGTGIWIETVRTTIAHCQLTGCGREGIFVTGEAIPIIVNCWFLQNQASGITFTRYAKGEIQRSLFCQNRFGLTLSDFASPLINQSEITENQVGMVLSGSSRPVLRDNQIAANAGEGLVVFSQAMPDLGDRQSRGGNYFLDNGDLAIRNVGSQPVIAVGNWLHPLLVKGAVEFRALQPVQTGGGDVESLTERILTDHIQPEFQGNSFDASDSTIPPDLANHWSRPFVPTILTRRIMGCFVDGTFQPDRPVSRAQFAASIVRAFQQPAPSEEETASPRLATSGFRDVPADHWAAESIAQAARMGFVAPEADLLFSPEQSLSRWQAIVSFVRGLGLKGDRAELLQLFRDRVEIPAIAVSAVATAVAHRLLVLPQRNRLNPLLPVTRAELAAWIYQALVLQNQVEARESAAIVDPAGVQDLTQTLTVSSSPTLQVPRLTAVGDYPFGELRGKRLRVAIDPEVSRSQDASAIAQANFWIAAQVAERLEQQGIAAQLTQNGDQAIDSSDDLSERRTGLQLFQPDLVLQIRLVAAPPETGAIGIQTQYAPPESQPFARGLHQKLLTLLDLPDREVIPLSNPPDSLAVPVLKVEFVLLSELLSRAGEVDRGFCTYVAEAIQQGLLQFLSV